MKQAATEDLETEGRKIAEQLGGLLYNGPWIYEGEFIGHTITDTHPLLGTGTTFICKDLEDCRERLQAHRDAFAAERSRFTQRLTGEMVKKFREEGILPPLPPSQEGQPQTIQDVWRETYGENAVLKTSERWDNIVKHLGYESYSVDPSMEAALSKILKTDRDLVEESQERLREAQIIPDARLSKTEKATLELARAITRQNQDHEEVKGVYAAMIPPASDRVRTAGMYATTLKDIYINLDQLDHGRQTVDTVIHELSHHRSGAEDLEEPHASMMSRIVGVVVEETSRGVYDDCLRNPAFVW